MTDKTIFELLDEMINEETLDIINQDRYRSTKSQLKKVKQLLDSELYQKIEANRQFAIKTASECDQNEMLYLMMPTGGEYRRVLMKSSKP